MPFPDYNLNWTGMIFTVVQVRILQVLQMRFRSSGDSSAARAVIVSLLGASFLCAPAAFSVESNDISLLQPQHAQLDNTPVPHMKLEGKAEVAAPLFTNLREWQASQYYKQGVSALSVNNLYGAAEQFRIAADGFAMANNGRFQAQAKYAEAQTRRLLRQYPQAGMLYGAAADLFRKYDPTSPYLKASIDQVALLSGVGKTDRNNPKKPLHGQATENELPAAEQLKSLPVMTDHVDKVIPLAANVTTLAGGVKVDSLKDADFFNGGNLLPQAAAVNVKDAYVKNTVLKAFTDMTCLEFAALGGNYYTAPDLYSAFKVNGKAIVVGASDQAFSPTVKITINGKQVPVAMDLPGMSRHSKNVLLVTDEQHVLAMDPRTKDTWKLVTSFQKSVPEFNWWKLTHEKKQKYISPNLKRMNIDEDVAGANIPGSLFNHTKNQSLFSHTKPIAKAASR
jgi:hypothetical protein